jgi:hypothetical protein
MSLVIADKTVLVTGANRGLGRALVDEALRRGAKRVYAASRQPMVVADERVALVTLDVTDRAQIQNAVDRVESLDILINNAGVSVPDDLSDRSAKLAERYPRGDPRILGGTISLPIAQRVPCGYGPSDGERGARPSRGSRAAAAAAPHAGRRCTPGRTVVRAPAPHSRAQTPRRPHRKRTDMPPRPRAARSGRREPAFRFPQPRSERTLLGRNPRPAAISTAPSSRAGNHESRADHRVTSQGTKPATTPGAIIRKSKLRPQRGTWPRPRHRETRTARL